MPGRRTMLAPTSCACDTAGMPEWTELTIEIPREHGEAMSSFLFDQGSTGVQEEDREERVRLRAYFDAEAPLAAVRDYAIAIGALTGEQEPADILFACRIDDEDWAETWRLHFTPLHIGQRLFVCPPWTEERPADRSIIVIDPGMAFGTGQHATTRMCLEAAEAAVLSRRIGSAMDLGCGSGIIAIALAKLGVLRVHAIDIDPLAREATEVNAACNQVSDAIVTAAALQDAEEIVDLIVANLFTTLLVEMAPTIAARLQPGGALVCSGFIETDAARVETALCAAGFVVRERCDEAPWVGLLLERR